jgi:hypothetical protein
VESDIAIEGNFGGANSAGTPERMYSAYLLVYVRREDAAEIFSPIPDEGVPQHLKDWLANPGTSQTEFAARKWSAEITLHGLDDSVRTNTLGQKVGFTHPLFEKKLTIDSTTTRPWVYQRAAELFELPEEEFRIWYSRFQTPIQILPHEDGPATVLESAKTVFVQKKTRDEPLDPDMDSVIIFLKFFCPEWAAPLQYIGSIIFPIGSLVADLITAVNLRMGFPEDTPLTVYREYDSSLLKPIPIPEDTLSANTILQSSTLVFEVESGQPTPATTFALSEPVAVEPSLPVETDTSELPLVTYSDFLQTRPVTRMTALDFYIQRISPTIRIKLFDHAAPSVLVKVIECPGALLCSDLRTFVIWATAPDYDESTDTFLLYPRDYHSEAPSQTPLIAHFHYASDIFRGRPYCYTLFAKGLTQEEYKLSILVHAQLSLTAYTIDREIDLFVPKGSVFTGLMNRLSSVQFFHAGDLLRAFLVQDGVMIPIGMTAPLKDGCTVRVELIPDDQRDLEEGDRMLQVSAAKFHETGFLNGTGVPFHIRVRQDATLADVKDEVFQRLGVAEKQAKKAKFVLGRGMMHFVPGNALTDKSPVIVKGTSILLVVLDPKPPSNPYKRKEEVLTIRN